MSSHGASRGRPEQIDLEVYGERALPSFRTTGEPVEIELPSEVHSSSSPNDKAPGDDEAVARDPRR